MDTTCFAVLIDAIFKIVFIFIGIIFSLQIITPHTAVFHEVPCHGRQSSQCVSFWLEWCDFTSGSGTIKGTSASTFDHPIHSCQT